MTNSNTLGNTTFYRMVTTEKICPYGMKIKYLLESNRGYSDLVVFFDKKKINR